MKTQRPEDGFVRKQKSCALLFAGLLVWLFTANTARAQGPVTSIQDGVAFEQRLGVQVPPDLVFRDENGESINLGHYFGVKPVILTLNYFHCPNLCSLELDQLAQAIADLPFNLGDEYEIVSVSIDPRETPEIAASTKWEYLRSYARPGRGTGWHFMTGDETTIQVLTQAVGFHYAYDASTDEYAHPIGILILTPRGEIARYLYGVDYPSRDLRLALVEASQNKIGSPIDQILLLCYHFDPSTGKYSAMVLNGTRVFGVATVLVIGLFVGWLWRKDLRHHH